MSHGNHIYTAKPPSVKSFGLNRRRRRVCIFNAFRYPEKNDIEFAIKLGITNSLSVITHYGAKNILLSYPAALKSMKKLKIKIKKKKL